MPEIVPEFVEFIPDKLKFGVLYISREYRTAVHLCLCGCGEKVVTPLTKGMWQLTENNGKVTLSPSIGNFQQACKSHYSIIDNSYSIDYPFGKNQISGMNVKCFMVEQIGHTQNGTAIYRRLDTGEEITDLPVGAMWFVSEEMQRKFPQSYRGGPDGKTLIVMTPEGTWNIDGRASNCGLPEDSVHRCWVRHGIPPNITVDKNGNTCNAGAGSIWIGNYHGHLWNGELTNCPNDKNNIMENLVGTNEEIEFWKKFIKTDRFILGWVAEGRNPELREDVVQFLNDYCDSVEDKSKVKMLDVGSGVVSILRWAVPGLDNNKQIIACDPLADAYKKIFNYQHYVIEPPVGFRAENIPFEDEFDIVHMSNALDHTMNPVEAYENLLQCTKRGGYVIVQGFKNEADHEAFRGMHQWNVAIQKNKDLPHLINPDAKYVLTATNRAGQLFVISDNPEQIIEISLENNREWFIWIEHKPE